MKEVMEMQKDSGEQEVGTYVRKAYEASLVKRILRGLLWAKFKNKLGPPLLGRQRWIFPIPPAKYN